MQARLAELESKVSFAEDLLDAVNRTVFRQQQQIEQLQAQMRALREQLHASLPAEPRGPHEEMPPHY